MPDQLIDLDDSDATAIRNIIHIGDYHSEFHQFAFIRSFVISFDSWIRDDEWI